MRTSHEPRATLTGAATTRRQLIGTIAASALGAAGLAGCSSSKGGSKTGSKSKSRSINVLTVTDPFFSSLKPLIPQFEKKTGIKVSFQGLATPTLYSRSTNLFQTKQGGVDVISPDSIHLSQFANQGWLIELDDLIKRDQKEIQFQDFIPQVVYSANEWKGAIYTIPVAAYAMDVLYRTDVFKALGLQPPPSKPSSDWTWDKYLSTVKAITGKTVGGTKMYGTVIAGSKPQPVVDMYTQLMASMGGRWFHAFPDAAKWDFQPELDSDANVQGLTTFQQLYKNSPPASVNYVWFDAGTAFAKGNVGMMYWWTPYNYLVRRSSYLGKQKSPIVGKYDIGALPAHPGQQQQMSIGNWSFGIGKYSKDREAAWSFIKWATSAKIQKQMALQPNHQFADFARRSLYSDADLLKYYDYLPSQLAAMELGNGKAARTPIPIYAELDGKYGDALNEMISQSKSAHDTATSAQKAVTDVVKQDGYNPWDGSSYDDTQERTNALIKKLTG